MMVTLCEPVESLLRDLWSQAADVVGSGLTHVPVGDGPSRVRHSLEALGATDVSATPSPRILFVHARGVGGATQETEAWLSGLAGFDLAVLYSEAWEHVDVMAPGRWKAGTRVIRSHLRSFLEQARTSRKRSGFSPAELAESSWHPLIQEHVLELLGLLAPAAAWDEWQPGEECDRRCRDAADRLVIQVRAAEASGSHEGWLRANGVLAHLRMLASQRSQSDALLVVIEGCLGRDPGNRRATYQALRADLLRLFGPVIA